MKRFKVYAAAIALALAGITSAWGQGQGAHPSFSGQKKMAIIMLSWSDRAAPASRQQVVDRMWNDPKSARNYYLAMSRGALEFTLPAGSSGGVAPANTPDVYGPYELSIAAGYSEDITYANAGDKFGSQYVGGSQTVARALAAADGYNAADYDYIMYVTPKADDTGGLRGYAGFNSNYSHNFEVSNRTINHELGHNVGMHHSNLGFNNGYGSYDCIMANNLVPHIDGPHTYQMGWYPDDVWSLVNYGQFDIENLAQPDSDNLKILRFDRASHGAVNRVNFNFWVEYRRRGIGHDSNLSGSWDRSVTIHQCQPSSRRPGDYFYNNLNNQVANLKRTDSFTGEDSTCTIRFLREDDSTGSATVQLIDPNGNQPPTIAENQVIVVPPGTTAFNVTANDPENNPLTHTIIAQPSVGSVSHVSGKQFSYTGTTQGTTTFILRTNDGVYDSWDRVITLVVAGTGVPSANAGPDQTLAVSPTQTWNPGFMATGLWLDANDAGTITESSGAITQWSDKSGNANHAVQSETNYQPTYDNTNSEIDFNGDGFQILNDPFLGDERFAAFFVGRWNASSSWGNRMLNYYGDSSIGWSQRQRGGSFDQFTFTIRGSNGGDDPTPSTTDNQNDFIGIGWRTNDATPRRIMRHNGTETYSGNDSGNIAYGLTEGRSALGMQYAGDNWTLPRNGLNGSMKEVIYVENANLTEVQNIEGYLAHKWGMVDELPLDHPHKLAAPPATGVLVTLNGTGNDPDGDALSYTWSQVSGPGFVNFANTSSASTTVALSAEGIYILRLTVTDGLSSVSDDIIIRVIGNSGPEIGISGNDHEIANGDSTPAASDGTGFGQVSSGSSTAHQFTIGNYGNADLLLSGPPIVTISGSSAFSVTSQPTSPIVTTVSPTPSLGTSDFTITFSPTDTEPHTATVSISSNDSDEPVYTFDISGNLPTVNVSTSDALANEAGPDTGSWTFTRSGGTAANLTVNYTLTGTATETTDYTLSSSAQIVIPAGSSSAILTLTPVVDANIEGSESAILSITDDVSYLVGSGEGTITIDEPANILVSTPNGGESYVLASSTTIDWVATPGGDVRIELLKNGAFHSLITSSTPNDGSYEWTIPLSQPAGNDYRVRVILLFGGTPSDDSDANFSIITDPLAAAVDAPSLVWSTSGDADWFAQPTTTHDGVDAAENGDIEDSQKSEMETTLNGPGTLTFWWKVSSESNFDYLRFYINDVEQEGTLARISGNIDWVQKTVVIPAGINTIKWAYTKDGSVSSNDDSAWVDQVVFTPDIPSFADWSGGAAFEDDANNDGVANGIAWLLGAADPNGDSHALLPSAEESASDLILSFTCLKSSYRGGASLKVQTSNDLGITDSWSNMEAEVPDASATINGIGFVINPNADASLIDVQARIPIVSGNRLFGRLEGLTSP